MYSVFFDIDGTLIQTGGAGKLAFAAAFDELFHVAVISRDVPFAGRSDRAIALDLMRVHGVDPSPDHWERFLRSYLRHLETTLAECSGSILPGVVELLDQLQAMDQAASGLLTGNVKSGAARKLSHYGLADRFTFGGFGDRWTDRNQIAQEALDEAHIHARGKLSGTMVIGDTVKDVHCARSIGAFAVAVATGGTPIEQLEESAPDLLIADLSDTQALLAEVEAKME